MKGMLRYLGLLACAVAVGVGCFLVDAKANPALWYVLWIMYLVLVLINIGLEWGIQPRWSSIASIVVFYIPTWIAVWLCSWGYIPGETVSWVALTGSIIDGIFEKIVVSMKEKHSRAQGRPMRGASSDMYSPM